MEEEYPKMTAFDRMVAPEQVQMLKAVIPYAPPRGQRFLSLYSKIMELQNTVDLFQRGSSDMSICSSSQPPASPMEILNEVRECCSPASRHRMDEFINMMAMIEMLELFQESDEP